MTIKTIIRSMDSWRSKAELVRVSRTQVVGGQSKTTTLAIRSESFGRIEYYPANRLGQIIGSFKGE